jgi:hypothetical protein
MSNSPRPGGRRKRAGTPGVTQKFALAKALQDGTIHSAVEGWEKYGGKKIIASEINYKNFENNYNQSLRRRRVQKQPRRGVSPAPSKMQRGEGGRGSGQGTGRGQRRGGRGKERGRGKGKAAGSAVQRPANEEGQRRLAAASADGRDPTKFGGTGRQPSRSSGATTDLGETMSAWSMSFRCHGLS